MASWTPWMVVSRSATICEIDTFMTLLSSTITNCAAARIVIGSQLRIAAWYASDAVEAGRRRMGKVIRFSTSARRERVTTATEPSTLEPASAAAPTGRRRSVLAGISLVLACLTILLATVAVWAHQVAFNTDRFTALAANAVDDPEVIDPLAARISNQV